MHSDGNLYIQLSKVLWATLKSLNDSCTPNVQESNNLTSFWKEIPNSLDRIHSNLTLCQDNLLILGSSLQIQQDEKYMFIYRPYDPSQQWIDIADFPLDLHKYTTNMSHIISLPGDQLLLFGQSGHWKEVMFLISFQGTAMFLYINVLLGWLAIIFKGYGVVFDAQLIKYKRLCTNTIPICFNAKTQMNINHAFLDISESNFLCQHLKTTDSNELTLLSFSI